MHEAHRLYFLYFALLAEGFLDILQVCSASGEYDSGEQLILITGELQLVPYVGKDFFGACSDDVVQRGQLNGASVFQCTYGGCLALFLFFVEGVAVLQFQLFGILLFHLQGRDVTGNGVATQRQYAQVAENIVLVDRNGGGIGAEVHQCTARTHLVFR